MRANSAFFEAALGRNWKEAADRVVRLPEEDEAQFHIFVQWVYRGLYRRWQDGARFSVHDLAHLYTMGSRLQEHDFQDAVIDFILYKWETVRMKPKNDTIHYVFQNTPSNDLLRRLLIDVCARCTTLAPFETNASNPIAEFYYELAKAAIVGIKGSKEDVIVDARQNCSYHQHGGKTFYRADLT